MSDRRDAIITIVLMIGLWNHSWKYDPKNCIIRFEPIDMKVDTKSVNE